MSAAAAVRSAETGHGRLKHSGKLFGQLAFTPTRAGDQDGPKHLRPDGEIVNVPSEGFFFPAVAGEPGREIPLGGPHVEIHSLPKVRPPEPAYTDVLRLR